MASDRKLGYSSPGTVRLLVFNQAIKLPLPSLGSGTLSTISADPSPVPRPRKLLSDPANLGKGWLGFDFEKAFGRPVKIINDAAMQVPPMSIPRILMKPLFQRCSPALPNDSLPSIET